MEIMTPVTPTFNSSKDNIIESTISVAVRCTEKEHAPSAR